MIFLLQIIGTVSEYQVYITAKKQIFRMVRTNCNVNIGTSPQKKCRSVSVLQPAEMHFIFQSRNPSINWKVNLIYQDLIPTLAIITFNCAIFQISIGYQIICRLRSPFLYQISELGSYKTFICRMTFQTNFLKHGFSSILCNKPYKKMQASRNL
jgi:hypothetical protein